MMTNFKVLSIWGGLLTGAALMMGPLGAAEPWPTNKERPNIVLVMTDDQGYGDFGCLGNDWIRTPEIDAMAARSATWQEFYVSPVCSPTRACLMTGRYNHRTKCIDTFLGRSMMATDEVTIAEVLSGAGYRTGIFGKWHLGDNYPMRPSDQGFEYSLVHKGGGLGQPADPRDNKGRYTDALLFENDREVPTVGYCTDVFFDRAFTFMRKSQQQGKPFFAYVALNAPHSPFHDVPTELYESYKNVDFASIITEGKQKKDKKENDKLARIASMITNIDDNMGRLFKELDSMGVTENTIVIFLTDNGPNTRRYVAGFQGKKSEVYEGGVRTPIWIQWPAQLKAGTVVKESVAAHIDLMPTLLDACGVEEIPANLDGRSVLQKLKQPDAALEKRPLVIQYHRGDEISKYHSCLVRKGAWKLVHPSGTQKEKFTGEQPAWELYNLKSDPGERKNLFAAEPELAAELIKEYEAWYASVSVERADQPGPPYIVIDKEKENPCVLTWQDMIEGTWRPTVVGYYKVDFAHSGRFDVRVEAAWGHKIDKSKKWTARLKIGDKEFTAPFDPETKMGVFEALELPAGKCKFEPSIRSESGETLSIYHARIMHR
ncbi:arylsulfatase [Verrucomicrobiaceae bacterium N1E253]|uniref:Arylsulfatase n=1 Tax=Oceaniferula marina TaxID=2748318 RepID=A0A851GHS8_9BACT|nr:arylsulfatase [Oceaniferula marina]NWK54785.1 arylsulfatase [Oceaniferula marina]